MADHQIFAQILRNNSPRDANRWKGPVPQLNLPSSRSNGYKSERGQSSNPQPEAHSRRVTGNHTGRSMLKLNSSKSLVANLDADNEIKTKARDASADRVSLSPFQKPKARAALPTSPKQTASSKARNKFQQAANCPGKGGATMERVVQKELKIEEQEDNKIPDQGSDNEFDRMFREMVDKPNQDQTESEHASRKENVSSSKVGSKGPQRQENKSVASLKRKTNKMMKALSTPIKDQAIDEEKPRVKRRILLNNWNTCYPVIRIAGEKCGFKVITRDHNLKPSKEVLEAYRIGPGVYGKIPIDDFDIVWFDLAVDAEVVRKLKAHQRINQWPGINVLTNKHKMAANLKVMQREFPLEYDFFPQTFNLPLELNLLKDQLSRQTFDAEGEPITNTVIVKPCHDCQGRGIYLIQKFDELKFSDTPQVAQTYIDNPFLINGLKFDIRLYVLLSGVDPLRIYLFEDGLARFATHEYVSASKGDITDMFTHLTNYSINKNNEKFHVIKKEDGQEPVAARLNLDQDDDSDGEQERHDHSDGEAVVHKRSYRDVLKIIGELGFDAKTVERRIDELLVKTIITGQNFLSNVLRTLHPNNHENEQCFQILGFDVLIDSNMKPWLIEINQSPSFATDGQVDQLVKEKLMVDSFKLLNLSAERRQAYLEEQEKKNYEWLMNPYRKDRLAPEEKDLMRLELDRERHRQEEKLVKENKLGLRLLYPLRGEGTEEEMKKYRQFIKKARQLQDEFTHGKVKLTFADKEFDRIVNAQVNNGGKPDGQQRRQGTVTSKWQQEQRDIESSIDFLSNSKTKNRSETLKEETEKLISLRKQIQDATQQKLKIMQEMESQNKIRIQSRFTNKRMTAPNEVNKEERTKTPTQAVRTKVVDDLSPYKLAPSSAIQSNLRSSMIPVKRQNFIESNSFQQNDLAEARQVSQPRLTYGAPSSAYRGILPEQFSAEGNFRNRYLNMLQDQKKKKVKDAFQSEYSHKHDFSNSISFTASELGINIKQQKAGKTTAPQEEQQSQLQVVKGKKHKRGPSARQTEVLFGKKGSITENVEFYGVKLEAQSRVERISQRILDSYKKPTQQKAVSGVSLQARSLAASPPTKAGKAKEVSEYGYKSVKMEDKGDERIVEKSTKPRKNRRAASKSQSLTDSVVVSEVSLALAVQDLETDITPEKPAETGNIELNGISIPTPAFITGEVKEDQNTLMNADLSEIIADNCQPREEDDELLQTATNQQAKLFVLEEQQQANQQAGSPVDSLINLDERRLDTMKPTNGSFHMLCLEDYLEVPVIEMVDDNSPAHSNDQFRVETGFEMNQSLRVDGHEGRNDSPTATEVNVTEADDKDNLSEIQAEEQAAAAETSSAKHERREAQQLQQLRTSIGGFITFNSKRRKTQSGTPLYSKNYTHRDELQGEEAKLSIEQEKSTKRLEHAPAVSHYDLDIDQESLPKRTADSRSGGPAKHQVTLSSATAYSEMVQVLAQQIKKQVGGTVSSQILPRNNASIFPKTQRQAAELSKKQMFINSYLQSKPKLIDQTKQSELGKSVLSVGQTKNNKTISSMRSPGKTTVDKREPRHKKEPLVTNNSNTKLPIENRSPLRSSKKFNDRESLLSPSKSPTKGSQHHKLTFDNTSNKEVASSKPRFTPVIKENRKATLEPQRPKQQKSDSRGNETGTSTPFMQSPVKGGTKNIGSSFTAKANTKKETKKNEVTQPRQAFSYGKQSMLSPKPLDQSYLSYASHNDMKGKSASKQGSIGKSDINVSTHKPTSKLTTQQAAKKKFIRVIEDLKAQGKEPVFNPVLDFVTNEYISHGTFAAVKKCTHKNTGYILALKSYEKKLLTRKTQLMAIHREIYILAGMTHHNIMRLFEVIDTKSHVHFVLELCPGKSLDTYVEKHGEKIHLTNDRPMHYLREKDAIKIFRQMVSAISYMHSLDVVHRDINTKGILISASSMDIKFTNFGFATCLQQVKGLEEITGLAPGDNDQDDYKKRDVFQIGIVLSILLFGCVPVWASQDFQDHTISLINCDQKQLPVDLLPRPVSQVVQDMLVDLLSRTISDCRTLAQVYSQVFIPRHKQSLSKSKNDDVSTATGGTSKELDA